MTTIHRIHRTLALAAIGFITAGAGHAQTWDMDACTGGVKAASGYTGCGTGNAAHGTLNIKAYSSTGASSNFTTANTSINNGGSYLGVWSGNENTGAGTTGQPHHAIDNVTAYGNAYELVHLEFSKAVDLGTLVANWTWSDGDFQVFRWNYSAVTPSPTITSFNPNALPGLGAVGSVSNGWQLVDIGDFSANLTQTISDASYFSSHWLVTTAFGGTNDGFKLGTITAHSVCPGSQTPGGGCGPSISVPEPATWALVLLAGAGATAARRRRD
jgi:hypothetical protein